MLLSKYRVLNFRSVHDSTWIECDNVTTLVGVNESGKSNLLLALWKLKPARDGEIDFLHDMPVSKLSVMRTKQQETPFIQAQFIIDENSATVISQKLNCLCEPETTVIITRFYDGHYSFEFPNGKPLVDSVDPGETENQPSDSTNDVGYSDDDMLEVLVEEIPSFVYYSQYGNLSSKIYLPHVITWLNGNKVDGIDVREDQVRTLRVLFEFVNLKPEEILELGKDPKIVAMERSRNYTSAPSENEIQKASADKEQRSILLQSAGAKLTREFSAWWKQGEYKFRFEADGDYFRIWVSDKKRPDEVALELRSTGLQWFLSFYLIFLVESQTQNKNAVLLLDEAGLTLHPLAQQDLCRFFENLSTTNQIINTTHSPFIVDTSAIDRCRVVYTDDDGLTVASSNLREGVGKVGDQSIYAVHAALGLSVSDILFQGCQPIVVEGPSDQFYMNMIKNYLLGNAAIKPKHEMIFVPSGGVRGVPGVVSLLAGKQSTLPYVLLDSDKSGRDEKTKLSNGNYKESTEQLIETDQFVDMANSEVEDLIPFPLLEKGVDHLFKSVEDEAFSDYYDASRPIVPQIEAFATEHEITLEKGWKVELAKSVKARMSGKRAPTVDEKYSTIWKNLFEVFLK